MQMEDVLLLPTLARAIRSNGRGSGLGVGQGVFIELGALDGQQFSNTMMLERCFGWRGMLIEANPTNFAKLNTSCRAAALLSSAICKDKGTVRMSLDGAATSGELGYLTRRRSKKRAARAVDVQCEPLSTLMARAGYPRADFLSLEYACHCCNPHPIHPRLPVAI